MGTDEALRYGYGLDPKNAADTAQSKPEDYKNVTSGVFIGVGTEELRKTDNTPSPIMQFESQEQLDACLDEWQDRLGLMDWMIKAETTSWHNFLRDDKEQLAAEASINGQLKSAWIMLRLSEEIPEVLIKKQPQEYTLIHELLHLRHFTEREPWDTLQGHAWEDAQHQNCDEIAMALFLAKYNLPHNWMRA